MEIGYCVLPHARGRGVGTTIARLLAEHAFSLGIERVAAYVNVGNIASERVLERAGFTREGVVRSLPVPRRRVDKTLFSCLDSTSDDEKAFTRQRHRSMEDNMSSVESRAPDAAGSPPVNPGEMKLEVVVIPVSDVDRAKEFYEALGWRLDADFAVDDGFRVVQLTPPGSGCSVSSARASRRPRPARRGPAAGRLRHRGGPRRARRPRRRGQRGVPRRDRRSSTTPGPTAARTAPAPEHADYSSFATFSDPDGNGWLLQEITTRLPGR